MTDEQSPPAIARANLAPGGTIAALVPQSMKDAFRLAKALSLSGDMVPKHFQQKPEMIMAAILRGAEIGLAPMQALSNIAVINGRASIWGDALPALIQRAGHSIDSWIEGEGDQAVAVAVVTRGDTGKEYRRTFSVSDAKKAGLWGKSGPWQTYPTRMLQMRARSYAARDGASDALMGLQVAEEMQDVPPLRDITPRPETRPTLAQRIGAAPMPPAVETPATVEVQAEVVPDPSGTGGFPGSAAWDEGVGAFAAGKAADTCPYAAGNDRDDWMGGFDGARRARE